MNQLSKQLKIQFDCHIYTIYDDLSLKDFQPMYNINYISTLQISYMTFNNPFQTVALCEN